jgi:hypothetical protein
MTTFTLDNPYGHQTKSGIKVEYVTKLDRSDGFVHLFKGRLFSPDSESLVTVNDLGNRHKVLNDELDIIDSPKPKQKLHCWVNFYTDGLKAVHISKRNADAAASSYIYAKRIACVEVNATEGDGIE